MNRILIVGMPGSGKSTLANRLGKKLDLPVFHLDKFYWATGWKQHYSSEEAFIDFVDTIAHQGQWIIDGTYRSSNIQLRLERADVIIFLDFPKWRCLVRALVRALKRKQPFDKREGVKDKFDWSLISWIVSYKIGALRKMVASYKDRKHILVAKTNRDTHGIVETIAL